MLWPSDPFSKHTNLLNGLIVLVIATISFPRMVFLPGSIFSIGMLPWSVETGVPAGKQMGATGIGGGFGGNPKYLASTK
jgi:hypothetical protein